MRRRAIRFVADDGGRAAAGYRGAAGDCLTRAVAIVTGMSYREAYDLVNEVSRAERHREGTRRSAARTGVQKATTRSLMEHLGLAWTPTMHVGSGCRVHLRADELPAGRLIVRLSKHVAAVIDGTLYDTHDCSRGGTRCVYGYWQSA